MDYEDLRRVAAQYYKRIKDLEAIETSLRASLASETRAKEQKIAELETVTNKCQKLEQELTET